MTTRRELGRIKSATFGFGGYDDAMIGFSVSLGGESWGVSDFKGTWSMAPTSTAKWTVEDQSKSFSDAVRFLLETLEQAKKKHVADLVGTPVEATFDGNLLQSWRVLTEVL